MFIYLITNTVNGKIYVGKLAHRKNLLGYWEANIQRALKGSKAKPYLYAAIRKYGSLFFELSTLEEVNTAEELAAAETKWIKKLHSNTPDVGYNLTEGGEGGVGHRVSAETRKKIGNARRGKPLSKEHREKLRQVKLDNPVRYWLGRKDKPPTTKGQHRISVGGKIKYVKEEQQLVSC